MPNTGDSAKYVHGVSSVNQWTIRTQQSVDRTVLPLLHRRRPEKMGILPPLSRVRAQLVAEREHRTNPVRSPHGIQPTSGMDNYTVPHTSGDTSIRPIQESTRTSAAPHEESAAGLGKAQVRRTDLSRRRPSLARRAQHQNAPANGEISR
jgi:hypothetical protein